MLLPNLANEELARFSIMVFGMSRISFFCFVWCFKEIYFVTVASHFCFFIFIFLSVYERCVHGGYFGSLLACMELCHLFHAYY